MTVNAAPRSAGPFTGDGTNTSFPFGFKTLASDDLIVVVGGSLGETVLVKDTDYTVALNPDQGVTPGGTVTYPISGPAMDSQHRLSVISGVPYEQATTLPNGGPFNPVTIEKALDNLAMQTQQVVEKVGRSMQIPVTSPEDATVLAAAVLVVKDNLPHIVGADQNKANIDAVVANATNINAVAGNATNINKVAAIDAAVTTVAAIDAAVTTVATNIADVGTVAANIANVSAAGANTSNINAVATDISNVNTVATNIANVNTVATDSANVATVATNIASVNTVAPNVGDVATVAADIVAVVDVSTNKAAILNAATTAQKWAENPEDTPVVPGQYSALHWAKKSESFAGGAIIGPASSTDGALVLFDGTDGKKGKVGPLLTTSTTDTTPGRVLKVGDFGLGDPVALSSAHNLNDITSPGFFTWGVSVPTNAPAGSARCDMLVNGTTQLVTVREGAAPTWIRTKKADGSWGPWAALHHTYNIKQTLGSNNDYPISQKAVTDAFGQPSTTASATFSAASASVSMTGVTAALGLEVGDVIEITGSASNNGLRTVDAISGDVLYLNIAHSTYGGLLAVVDETVSCTIKRIAKWYHASLGLGQALVNVGGGRALSTTYTNTTGRSIQVYVGLTGTGYNGSYIKCSFNGGAALTVGANVVGGTFGGAASATITIPRGATYNLTTAGEGVNYWNELR